MDSDANSDITVYHTISQFGNSDLETPDEFANSNPRPSTFSQPPFRLRSQPRKNFKTFIPQFKILKNIEANFKIFG